MNNISDKKETQKLEWRNFLLFVNIIDEKFLNRILFVIRYKFSHLFFKKLGQPLSVAPLCSRHLSLECKRFLTDLFRQFSVTFDNRLNKSMSQLHQFSTNLGIVRQECSVRLFLSCHFSSPPLAVAVDYFIKQQLSMSSWCIRWVHLWQKEISKTKFKYDRI